MRKKRIFLMIFLIFIFLLVALRVFKDDKTLSFEVSNIDGGKLVLRRYSWGYPVKINFRKAGKANYTLVAVKTEIPDLQEEFGYPILIPIQGRASLFLLLLPPSLLEKDLFRGKDQLKVYLSLFLREERGGNKTYIKLMKKLTIYRR